MTSPRHHYPRDIVNLNPCQASGPALPGRHDTRRVQRRSRAPAPAGTAPWNLCGLGGCVSAGIRNTTSVRAGKPVNGGRGPSPGTPFFRRYRALASRARHVLLTRRCRKPPASHAFHPNRGAQIPSFFWIRPAKGRRFGTDHVREPFPACNEQEKIHFFVKKKRRRSGKDFG